MNYWLNLFTGPTWHEFRDAGGQVSGFRKKMRKAVERIEPGDILLCYITGIKRWTGAVRVLGPSDDTSEIWSLADFPVRLSVETLIWLPPENGIPMEALEGKVAFYEGPKDAGKYKAFVRSSPRLFQRRDDGELIMSLLREAEKNPVNRPFDPKKYGRKPLFAVEAKEGRKTVKAEVSIPEEDEEERVPEDGSESSRRDTSSTRHTEIQYQLLALGADMGFDVWVARNDRSRTFSGRKLGELPRNVDTLPTQFNEATNKTIELIDVLWLQGNSIMAAFEIESTTSVYSGLLRMSDLLALQPNLEIDLYLVAPEDRRNKVEQELLRPTFQLRSKPLHKLCGFIGFDALTKKVEGLRRLGLQSSLKPDFLKGMAEYFEQSGIDR